jgi:N-acetylmuramoyl-L-alanine amidase
MNIIDLGLKFKEMTPGNIPRTMYLHHSGGIRTVAEYHQQHLDQGWAGLGYNFAVDIDGKVYKGREPKFLPAGILGFNQDSLHIVAIGNFENMVMPDVQRESIKELIPYCKNLYSTIREVKGHGEVMATDCPGKNYPLQAMKDTFILGLIPVVIVPTPSPIQNRAFKLQHILNTMGFTDASGHKLVEDGWIGDRTKEALSKVAVKRGQTNLLVGWIQEELHIHVDNEYGASPYRETYDAIVNYQRSKQLVVDGVAGINTILKLLG